MNDKLSEQQNEAIIKALDEAITDGPWDESNFLRAIGKNLQNIRDNFIDQMDTPSKQQIKAETHLTHRLALRSGQQEVFVSLYSSDGTNMQSWEKIIANLPRQMISRPIYLQETQIREMIKTKENKQNEAYVAIFINHSDVISLTPDKALTDKLGNPLLTLKDKTLDLDNISRFVHTSGVYRFERGRLLND